MRILSSIFVITLLIFMAVAASAQPNIPPDPPSAAVPLSGLEILLLAGGALGVKKLWNASKNKKS